MPIATISAFENTVHTSNEWLEELTSELGRDEPQQAYRILRAVLLPLRDRLSVEEATDLGAQLPMLLRGVYYEGYNPSKTPTRQRNQEDFLADIAQNLEEGVDGSPEDVARAVFKLLAHHVTGGEIEHVKSNLPEDLRALWD